ncbi:hypothetical protein E2C01_013193 [Portunus trituberculatus]|uniref:Uncharacterized protein n=1 Tax=Portunus trituberculatus TaxID=210409 RepID=A0A5B7DGM2_PORTR|nr:hypothetical protein [Portunus trituberculatus]
MENVFNDGIERELLNLAGTIPVRFKGERCRAMVAAPGLECVGSRTNTDLPIMCWGCSSCVLDSGWSCLPAHTLAFLGTACYMLLDY